MWCVVGAVVLNGGSVVDPVDPNSVVPIVFPEVEKPR